MRVSIVIITRNRADFLDRCLNSIVNQTVSPGEVVVVDNNSIDHTQSVINKYKKNLSIKSIRETRVGIPYARNAGIKIAKGDIVTFLDDDCVASATWLSSIEKFFIKYALAVGVIGNTSVANRKSVPALVEFAYNRRWILTHIENPKTICKIRSGVVIDFKNAAFRLEFIKQFQFSSHAPYGDAGSNEDAEIGFRMFQRNHNIFYNPSMKATHVYSSTFKRLLWRNFWGGYGDMLLLLNNQINLRETSSHHGVRAWLSCCAHSVQRLNFIKKLSFYCLLLIYPLFSKAGGILAIIIHITKAPLNIPQR